MLNCTTRKQAEKVMPSFFKKWPNPLMFLKANEEEVSKEISALGFQNKRAKNLLKMTSAYTLNEWKHASELPGIGDYASRAWEIFFKNELGKHKPIDGALALYWNWRKKHGS
jgi:endonuclease III